LVSAENLITEPEAAALYASQFYVKRGLAVCDRAQPLGKDEQKVTTQEPRRDLRKLYETGSIG